MTTSVNITNNGPWNVEVTIINFPAGQAPAEKEILEPGQTKNNVYVYENRSIAIREVEPESLRAIP